MSTDARILITGGAGFIGANAIDYFRERGYTVFGTDKVVPRLSAHVEGFTQCDLLDGLGLKRLVANLSPDLILHLGARTDTYERKSLDGYAANIEGMRNLVDAANTCPAVRRIIVTSSRLVCRTGYRPKNDSDYCPPNFYGQSKVETERITRDGGISAEWLITRPTAIWGPGFVVPSYRDFFEQIRNGRYVHLGRRNPCKTFGYVKNFVFQMERLFLAGRDQVHGRVFYVGDYQPVRLRDWADTIASEFGRPPLREVPIGVLRFGGWVGDQLRRMGWNGVPLTSYRLANMIMDTVHDCSALETITGPLPYDLARATCETVQWMKINP